MKKQLLILFVLISTIAFGQAPQFLNYQAVARAGNAELANKPIGIEFTIHDQTTGGTIVYQETHSATTNAYGLFTVKIGEGTPTNGTFDGINWGNHDKFLQVKIDTTNSGNYSFNLGTTQLVSVPYALQANKADTAKWALGAPAQPEVDGSVTNELQSLSLNGDSVKLSLGGGAVAVYPAVTVICEQQASGVNSLNTSFTSPAWNQRAFTTLTGSTTNVSLNGANTTNATITLQPGTYHIVAYGSIRVAHNASAFFATRLRFISVSNANNLIAGQNVFSELEPGNYLGVSVAPLDGIITVSGAAETFKLEQFTSTPAGTLVSSTGGTGDSSVGVPEKYASVTITKIQ